MNKLRLGSSVVVLMVALVAIASFPNVVYADPVKERVEVGDTFTITSYRGVAFAAEKGETTKKTAVLKLTIQVTEVQDHRFKFKTTSGTINVDGEDFFMTSAFGAVGFDERPRLVALNASITDGDVHLRGRFRAGEGTVALVGLMCIDDVLYCLRLFSNVERT